MAFESFLDDTAPLLRKQLLRVDTLPYHKDEAFDMGVRIAVDKTIRPNTGMPDTELSVVLDPETAGGFAAMMGVADEMAAIYPYGIRLVVQNHADEGYFVLADPFVAEADGTWIQTTPRVLKANSERGAGDGYLRLYEMYAPGFDEESPVFQALLNPSIALAGTEYAIDVATRRIQLGDGI